MLKNGKKHLIIFVDSKPLTLQLLRGSASDRKSSTIQEIQQILSLCFSLREEGVFFAFK